MNRLCKRLHQTGLNPRLVLLILVYTTFIGYLVVPLLQNGIAFGVIRQGDICQCDLKLLGSFKFDELTGTLENIPPIYRRLDGKKVALEGFMCTPCPGKVSNFIFAYDVTGTDWGPRGVQNRVFVSAPDNQSFEYTADEVRVIGTLHIKLDRDTDTGRVISIFKMDLDRIEPL